MPKCFVFGYGCVFWRISDGSFFVQKLKQNKLQAETGCGGIFNSTPLLMSMVVEVIAFSDNNGNEKGEMV